MYPLHFSQHVEQNALLDYLEWTVRDFAVPTVKHLAYVTKWRGNVKVDVRLDGLNINVIQVWKSNNLLHVIKAVFSDYSST